MRAIAIVLLTCACFGCAIGLNSPVVYADPGTQVLPDGKHEDNIDADKVREFHWVKSERFVAVDGFGARRIISMFDMNRFPLAKHGSDEYWELVSIDVVGHARTAPVTYLTKQIVNREKLNEIPTRALDGFEARGLEALRKKLGAKEFATLANAETAHWQRDGERLRILGSLRATKSCLECHKAKEGELLGALSYTLKKVHKYSASKDGIETLLDQVSRELEAPAAVPHAAKAQSKSRPYQQVRKSK